MKPALILLTVLVVTGAILWLLDRLFPRRTPDEAPSDDAPADDAPAEAQSCETSGNSGCTDDCCAIHEICPSQEILKASMEPVTYYDDQELDAYRGRAADGYSDDELEQWRDILYTLQPSDLMGWQQSVKRRGIVMPAVIRDEFVQLVADSRTASGAS